MQRPLPTSVLSRSVSDQLVTSALGQLAEAVTVHDAHGRILYANDAAVVLLGFDTADELLTAEPGALMAGYRVFHPDGRPVSFDELPGRRVLAGEQPEPLLVRWFPLRGDELRWSLIKATALCDESGEVLGAINVMEDVTQVQEAEFAQRLLAEAGETLASSMDYLVTLQHVAEMAVPRLADWCGVDVVDPRGAVEHVAVAHVDPSKTEFARTLRRRYPPDPNAHSGVAAVLRSGGLELYEDITDEQLVPAARDEQHLAMIRELGLRSVLIVPLPAGDRVIGALTLVLSGEGRRFTRGDIVLAQELGRRAGGAVENARIFTESGRIARLLQASLLPSELPSAPGWETATLFRPAGDDMNLVGGDFYDARVIEDELLVCVGDVAGKGAGAAALTSRVRHSLMTAVAFTGDLAAAFDHVNRLLLTVEAERDMCTAAAALLRWTPAAGASALIGLAGHPQPMLLRDGEVEPVGRGGTILGAAAKGRWPVAEVPIEPGDVLLFYTDGITDAVGAGGERFGFERMAACLRTASPPTAAGVVAALQGSLRDFERGRQRDDIALLAVQRLSQ